MFRNVVVSIVIFSIVVIRQPPLWGHQAVRVKAQVSEFSYQCLVSGYRIWDLHSLLGIGDWGPQKTRNVTITNPVL